MRTLLASLVAAILLLPAHAASGQVTSSPAADLPPQISDDGDRDSLLEAIAHSRSFLNQSKKGTLLVGERQVSLEQLRQALSSFEELVRTQWGLPEFEQSVKERFTWVPMPLKPGAEGVHITGYYLPLLEARTQPDEVFRYPLYAPPPDMIPLDLGAFRPSLAGQVAMARFKNGRLVPYYNRKEIDEGQALTGRGLEIAWVADENARASLMIQGSGVLKFGDGRLVNIGYAAQNGHIFLAGDQKQNPSYVFFRLGTEGPVGCDGVPLVGGRAIATDKRLFPTGTLAFISYPKAKLDARGQVSGFDQGGRFVLDQDTGGAITGPGRVDLFWGGGPEAARRAHSLNGTGKLWFLLPKEPPVAAEPQRARP